VGWVVDYSDMFINNDSMDSLDDFVALAYILFGIIFLLVFPLLVLTTR
jgi:hypothetical protein